VRIAAKKLRYATEFFAPLYPRKRTRAYRRALADLQQVLGEFNDASVAPRVVAAVAGPAAPATAAMAAWAAARSVALEPAIVAAWRAFAKARPFWKRAADA
jgi:CHAD domain-containing protein